LIANGTSSAVVSSLCGLEEVERILWIEEKCVGERLEGVGVSGKSWRIGRYEEGRNTYWLHETIYICKLQPSFNIRVRKYPRIV
jgi:hypothetical protein